MHDKWYNNKKNLHLEKRILTRFFRTTKLGYKLSRSLTTTSIPWVKLVIYVFNIFLKASLNTAFNLYNHISKVAQLKLKIKVIILFLVGVFQGVAQRLPGVCTDIYFGAFKICTSLNKTSYVTAPPPPHPIFYHHYFWRDH